MKDKDKVITVRFNSEQLEYIKARAEKADMTLSKYVRTMVLDGKIVQLEGSEYRTVMTEMSCIGSNIN